MFETDVPNYKIQRPGVVVNTDEEGLRAYQRQSRILNQKIIENQSLQTEINNIKDELDSIKSLVAQLLNKAQ